MNSLSHRQQKIQEKRKQTPWREFVRDICSWMPMNFYKIEGKISRYPQTGREGKLCQIIDYETHEIFELSDINTSSFFQTFHELFVKNPKMIVQQRFINENSEYAECYSAKNTYLSFSVGQNVENILYTAMSHTNLSNIIDSFIVVGNCDNIYNSKSITNSYNVCYSSNIHNSSNIRFCANLLGCQECFFCDNLENQEYCIKNTKYEKDEYLQRKQEILRRKDEYNNFSKHAFSINIDNKVSERVNGRGIVKSTNIENGYFVQNVTHGKNLFQAGGEFGGSCFYDSFDAGNQTDEHLYATHYVGESSSHVYCVSGGAQLHNCYYGFHLENCSFCLGCIGLKNKSYCIFNKQYSKDERYEKVDEIFSQMEQDGTLGEFFPATMNPFYFNDTAAYLIDPSFTKEEVTAKGFLWRDEEIKVDIPEWMETVSISELANYERRIDDPESVNSESANQKWFIDPAILKKVIIDEKGNSYRVIKMEYDFLMKYGLPLPRRHRLERMKENFRIS